jgi:uncharacterized membrane protein
VWALLGAGETFQGRQEFFTPVKGKRVVMLAAVFAECIRPSDSETEAFLFGVEISAANDLGAALLVSADAVSASSGFNSLDIPTSSVNAFTNS